MERGSHSRAERIDGGQRPADDDALGSKEGDEVCHAMPEEGACLTDGCGHLGDSVACRLEQLSVVLVGEADSGQVGADRVSRSDGFEASDVATLAWSPRCRVNGNVGDVAGEAASSHEGDALHEVGPADGRTRLDVDERVDGRHSRQSASIDRFSDGARARIVFDRGGEAALSAHRLGDVDSIPPRHAGRTDHARVLGIDGAGHGDGKSTDTHSRSLFLTADLLHDDVQDRFGAPSDVDEKAGSFPHSAGRIRECHQAVVSTEFDERERARSVGCDEATSSAPTR